MKARIAAVAIISTVSSVIVPVAGSQAGMVATAVAAEASPVTLPQAIYDKLNAELAGFVEDSRNAVSSALQTNGLTDAEGKGYASRLLPSSVPTNPDEAYRHYDSVYHDLNNRLLAVPAGPAKTNLFNISGYFTQTDDYSGRTKWTNFIREYDKFKSTSPENYTTQDLTNLLNALHDFAGNAEATGLFAGKIGTASQDLIRMTSTSDNDGASATLKWIKDGYNQRIDSYNFLTEAEKQGFKNQINSAATPQDAKAIEEQAYQANEKTKAQKMAELKAALNKAEYTKPLTNQLQTAMNDANSLVNVQTGKEWEFKPTTTLADVNKAIEDLNTAVDAAKLAAAKDAAKATIDVLANLSDTEKDKFKADVDAATTAEAVKTVEGAAKAKDAENKAAADAAAALEAAKSDLEKAIAAAEAVKASDAYTYDDAADQAGLDKALTVANNALNSNDKAVVDAAKAGLVAASGKIDGVAPVTPSTGSEGSGSEGAGSEGSNPGSGSEGAGSEGSNPGSGSEGAGSEGSNPGSGSEGAGSEGSNPGSGSEGAGSEGSNPGSGSEGAGSEGSNPGSGSEGAGSEGSNPGSGSEGAGSEGSNPGSGSEGAGSEGSNPGSGSEGAGSEGSNPGSGSEGAGSEGSNPGSGSEGTGSEGTGSEGAGSEGSNPGTGSEGTGSEGAGSEGSNPGTGSEGAGSVGEGSEGSGSEGAGSEGSNPGTGSEGAGSVGEGAGTVNPGADAEDAALETAKEEGKEAIDGLENLSDTEKDGFKAQVDAANSVDAVDAVVDTAKAQDAENKDAAADAALETAKDAANGVIDGLANLSAAEKEGFKAQVEAATTPEAVKTVADAAKAKDAANKAAAEAAAALEAAKEAAKETIDGLPNLSAAEKEGFKADVDAATTPDAVKAVVAAAEAKDAANQAGAVAPGTGAEGNTNNNGGGAQQGGENAAATQADKDALNSAIEDAKGVKDSDSYKNASDDKKAAFDAALAEAETVYGDSSATSTHVKEVTTKLIEAQKALDGTTTEAPAENGSSWGKWLLALIPAVLGLIGIGSYVVYVNQVDGGDRAPLQRGQANPADYIRWIQNLPARTDGGL